MKKAIVSLLFVGLFATTTYPFQLGLEFSAGGTFEVGANLRFNHLFELKPQLGFEFTDGANRLNLLIDGNFYLPDISELQHYAGFGLDMRFQSNTDGTVALDGHYGLRYNINEIVSIFGQGGIQMNFDPFVMATFKSELGCTIYFPKFE